MIGTYRVAGHWHEATSIFWIEPPRNASGIRYLAVRQPRGLDRPTLNKLVTLSHPRLARVLGQTQNKQGEWYLIVESVPGEPLDIVQGKLGVLRATRVFEKILGALIYLHEQGWVIVQKTTRAAEPTEDLWNGNPTADTAGYDPVKRFHQAFALDAQDVPTMFDFTIWEPAPDSLVQRDERIRQDIRLTVGLLYWLHTSGRLSKNLEALRKNSGQIEQFLLNVLQEQCPSFQELGEKFAQAVKITSP
jgi:hypothetical protein